MPQTANITSATVLKAIGGRVLEVNVQVAGTGVGTINDCATTGAASASNALIATPNTAGPTSLALPVNFGLGIVVTPGTGQTIGVMWE